MTDQKMEGILAQVLRAGVMTAAAVVLAGGVWYLAVNGWSRPAYRTFQGSHLVAGGADTLIHLGLLLLIATPVARVAFSLVAFGLERDWVYVGITLTVLSILLWSLFGA